MIALDALVTRGYPVVAVYTQPDRPAGRGRKLRASPVKSLATKAGIKVEHPPSLKRDGAVETLSQYDADLMIVAAYGLILPQAALDIPRFGCVNIHASILPRWRGAAPIQRAIIAGDQETGVSIMQMDAGLDTGKVLNVRTCPITPADTGGTLHDRLAVLGAEAMLATLDRLESGNGERLEGTAQLEQDATYAHRLSAQEAFIDWSQPAAQLERLVRAFDPWPRARIQLGDVSIRLWGARVRERSAPMTAPGVEPGTILDLSSDAIGVKTSDGVLELLRVQRAGGKPMAAGDFLNGSTLQAGQRFEPAPALTPYD